MIRGPNPFTLLARDVSCFLSAVVITDEPFAKFNFNVIELLRPVIVAGVGVEVANGVGVGVGVGVTDGVGVGVGVGVTDGVAEVVGVGVTTEVVGIVGVGEAVGAATGDCVFRLNPGADCTETVSGSKMAVMEISPFTHKWIRGFCVE